MVNMKLISSTLPVLFGLLLNPLSFGQGFYFGNDLSYVNEMEDCGVIYRENGTAKDPYSIFADRGCNLVRLRLWHTPSWYDSLDTGKRYSDFADVKKSIQRAKAQGMQVLLDFHLSDNWADPGKQRVPAAWLAVVDNLPLLQDSLYNYIHSTLSALDADNLLPELVQIGNETNKGILLSPEDDQSGWVLDWDRNAALFNTAIQAVRDVEQASGKPIKVAIHPAGPDNATWLIKDFIENGVTDFDIIGISYYWAWHKPTTIAQTGEIISQLRTSYPDKEVMIFETAHLWTWANNDSANNIYNDIHPDYSPPSPETQKAWMVDLTQTVMDAGGSGVIYWEPAWVSSPCHTQWGQGSHAENAAFFDFENELMENGGIAWMQHNYTSATSQLPTDGELEVNISLNADSNMLVMTTMPVLPEGEKQIQLTDGNGRVLLRSEVEEEQSQKQSKIMLKLPELPAGLLVVTLFVDDRPLVSGRVILSR